MRSTGLTPTALRLIRLVVVISAFLIGGDTVAVVAITITPFLAAVLPALGNSLLADLRLLTNAHSGQPSPLRLARRPSAFNTRS